MLAVIKVKMSGSEKKGAVTCNEEDSRCNNNGKEISQKVCYTCKVVGLFLLIRPTDFFAVLVAVAVWHYKILFSE